MDLNMLSLFDYVTQGISSDVDLDCDIANNVELNFDDQVKLSQTKLSLHICAKFSLAKGVVVTSFYFGTEN